MKEFIQKTALETGFSAVGVTSAEPVDALAHINDAIDSGRTASMSWLGRDPKARCDPGSMLAGAKSVICLALAYSEDGYPGNGRIDKRRARYARGADYHKFISDKLEGLWGLIKKRSPDSRAKICVDTNPIVEKALAMRAGIGWIGKHTILVNERLGSWFMLGEIVTDIELKPDIPARDRCGECDLCIAACPTSAVIEPCKLDLRRCISYFTTARKEEPPGDIRGAIPEGAFGCDICQEACPYNK